MTYRAVESAEVSPDATVGDGTSLWHLCQVREHAVLGASCVVGRGAYIGPGVRMGDNCTGSPASTIIPLPTTIATCPSHTARSPGISEPPDTTPPMSCSWANRGMSSPASRYAHCVRPLQSSPTPGVVPPHW